MPNVEIPLWLFILVVVIATLGVVNFLLTKMTHRIEHHEKLISVDILLAELKSMDSVVREIMLSLSAKANIPDVFRVEEQLKTYIHGEIDALKQDLNRSIKNEQSRKDPPF